MSAVSACQTTGPTDCDGFKPIRPTVNDARIISDSLVRQILEQNEYGAKQCGWKRSNAK